MIAPTDCIALTPEAGDADTPPRAAIVTDGQPTGIAVEGVVLEAAFATDLGTLMLVTDDSPYEERLHIYLFDREWRLIDRAELGQIYTGGIVRDVTVLSPAELRFRFHDAAIVLELLDRPERVWWPWGEPGGARRPVGLRHFRLREG